MQNSWPLFHNSLVVAGSEQRFTVGIKGASFLPPPAAVCPCTLPGQGRAASIHGMHDSQESNKNLGQEKGSGRQVAHSAGARAAHLR